jgi:hypothetical protein
LYWQDAAFSCGNAGEESKVRELFISETILNLPYYGV